MDKSQLTDIAKAITEAGLAGRPESVLVAELCARAVAAGTPLARATVIVDTLHPIYEGRVFRWARDTRQTTITEYGRSDEGEALDRWRSSTFYRLQRSDEPFLYRRLTAETETEFSIFPELRQAGMTGYLAMVTPFAAEGIIGDMDCVYSSWVTDVAEGFGEADLRDLQQLVPFLALAVKSASLARIAGTLVETYLGRDAGRRVSSGRIAALCRSVEQPMLLSAAFAAAVGEAASGLVSVGRYARRGVGRPQDLFTIEVGRDAR